MMKTNNKKLCATLLCVLVLVVFITSATYAWLSIGGSKDVDASFGDFKVKVNSQNKNGDMVSVSGLTKVNGLSSVDYESTKKTLKPNENYTEYYAALDNYVCIDNLTISIEVDSKIAGYMRVKILDEWKVTRDFKNLNKVSQDVIFRATDEKSFMFALEETGWVYDPVTKYCYYSNLIEKSDNPKTIEFIVKGSSSYIPKISSYYSETCEVTLALEVEIVQANRFEALWGIEEIPQPVKEDNSNA